MRKSYAIAEPVERAAKKGDLVSLTVDAALTQPAENEKSEVLKDSPLQVVIGEDDSVENDFPYPGLGMSSRVSRQRAKRLSSTAIQRIPCMTACVAAKSNSM